MSDVYKNLVSFWNDAFAMNEEEKSELVKGINPEEDYQELAPSKKLYDVLSLFSGKTDVLDYGCGNGWASIIMAKKGASSIVSVDVAPHAIESTLTLAQAYCVEKEIHPLLIDEKWLNQQKDAVFEGIFSSNVLDIIPLEMTKSILKEMARVLKEDGVAVFSFNYHADLEAMKKRGAKVEGNSVFIDGVLRLTSLSDEEWKNLFSDYFEITSLSYFSWPGEEKETRRLFVLRKKPTSR